MILVFPLGLSGASGDQSSLPLSLILSDSPEGLVIGSPLDALRGSPPVDLSHPNTDFVRRGFHRRPGLSGQSGYPRVSEPCSTVAFGPGGPFSL